MDGSPDLRSKSAWLQQSPYSWIAGDYTICAVRVRGETTYELWRNGTFIAKSSAPQKLRTMASRGGAVA